MTTTAHSLLSVFDGWNTYQVSLVHAVKPLTPEQLAYRPATGLRSAGELASHIGLGRIDWFSRMGAPGSAGLAHQVEALASKEAIADDSAQLVYWLEASWRMVEGTLRQWTVDDLATTFIQPYWGKNYAVSRQWTIWRIMAHDLHHGGELAVMLGMQGIPIPDLGDLGGHLNQPPLAEP